MVRAQGFRALGRLYEEQRQDLVKAVQAYQAAVQADPQDVDSLERLARVYRDAEDWTSCVNVLLRLAEVEPRPRAKVQVLLELAAIYEHAFGDLASAVLAHEKALEVEPGDTAAMLRLAELHERTGNWRALGEQADAFVRALPAEDRGRAVPLLLRVADAFEQRVGDDARAIQELRVAQSIDPARPEVIEALARVYAKHADTWPLAIDCHRQLLRQDPFRTDSYHQMRRLFERQGELDKAFVVCELLVFLRAARQDEDLFFQEHKVRVPSFAARPLTREEHEGYVVHPDERGVARLVLEILGADAGKAFPGDLAAYELNPRTDRFAPRAEHPVRRIADGLAEILGAPAFDLWITKKYELGLFVENGEPPAMIVGAGLPRRVQERELRFLLARQLERLKSAQQLLLRLPPRELELAVLGAARLVRPELRFDRDPGELDAASKRVARALSRRGRKLLEDLGPQLAQLRLDVERQRQASVLTALRAGFALTNDVEVVARSLAREVGLRAVFADAGGAREALGGSPEMRHLLTFAVSEEYFELRRRLQFSIQS
jgi:tetratricopeptide (TPR) repeat protein